MSAEPPVPRCAAVHYREPPRGYRSALVPAVVISAGFVGDIAIGGASAHLWAWLAAFVVVVGTYVLLLYAARSTRTITVDADEVRVGEESIDRGSITGIDFAVDPSNHVLGMALVDEVPRGAIGLTLVRADGPPLVVPTKFPQRLADVLGLVAKTEAIRPAEPDDLALLDEIADRADTVFRVAGYALPSLPLPSGVLDGAQAIFVIGRPAFGFVVVGAVDGCAHVDELAVLPGRMRKGIGSDLLAHACRWATAEGYAAITLTTYADVPWNAPFYTRRGFVPIEALTPELAARRADEREIGLDEVGPRIAMRRELGDDSV